MGLLSKGKQPEQKPVPTQPKASEQKPIQAKATTPAKEKKPKGTSQKDAVFNEVKKVVNSAKINVVKGKTVASFLTKEQRKSIVSALMEGFKAKRYPLKDTEGNRKKLADDKLLRSYVIGLLKNWLERDKRLQNQEGEFLQG